ncbi:hypothetical protein VIGAN_10010400, partial [Vigna angularis var. angularis]
KRDHGQKHFTASLHTASSSGLLLPAKKLHGIAATILKRQTRTQQRATVWSRDMKEQQQLSVVTSNKHEKMLEQGRSAWMERNMLFSANIKFWHWLFIESSVRKEKVVHQVLSCSRDGLAGKKNNPRTCEGEKHTLE